MGKLKGEIMKRFLLLFLAAMCVFLCCSFSANALTLAIPEYTTTDQEECKDYIAEHKIEWVPSYEDVSFLGDWERFTWSDLGDYENFSYTMKCPSGEGVHVINYRETHGFDELSSMLSSYQESPYPSDGWLFPEESRRDQFYYKFENFYYFYGYQKYEKRFYSLILWFDEVKPCEGKISFSCSDTELCDFRKELMHVDTAQNAINRLLVATGFDPLETAPPADEGAVKTSDGTVDAPATDGTDSSAVSTDTAPAEIDTATPAPAEQTSFPWLWVMVPAGVIIFGGALTAVLLIRKKRKQS